MTREEHIKWCKERAFQEMNFTKDPKQAIISMMSDLGKHPETNGSGLSALCMMQLMRNPPLSKAEIYDFINGFN